MIHRFAVVLQVLHRLGQELLLDSARPLGKNEIRIAIFFINLNIILLIEGEEAIHQALLILLQALLILLKLYLLRRGLLPKSAGLLGNNDYTALTFFYKSYFFFSLRRASDSGTINSPKVTPSTGTTTTSGFGGTNR